jgi:glycerol-3-phosphate dehydrogenase
MKRGAALDRLGTPETWDVIVVGGGATGLGTAVDATARGYRTLLLEAFDFGKGTSSRSTKLVHGGVRYLRQGNIPLVREGLHERGLLRRNAPHLVHVMPFVIPSYTWWSRPFYGIGLVVYDVLAGRLGVGGTRLLSRAEALDRIPTLEPTGLRGGVLYFDGQFDDARLGIALLRTFENLGGTALNYMPVTGLLKERGRVAGVHTRDAESGAEYTMRARAVVNATGVYADSLRRMDDARVSPMLAPSQGVHVVLDRSFLPSDSAIMIPATDDGRVLFAIPWHGRTVVGTTDTAVDTIPIEPRPFQKEIDFVLHHAARYLHKKPEVADVRSMFAGLRPLVRSGKGRGTAALARDHTLVVSEAGLITITGGKWTTYRRMGKDAVDRAIEVASLPARPCPTEQLRLHGWQETGTEDGLAEYGSDAPAIRQLFMEQPGWNDLLHPELPYRAGEVVWAARHECARTVEDVLARRTRAILLDARASKEMAPRVAALLADELGFDAQWQVEQVRQFAALADGYLPT